MCSFVIVQASFLTNAKRAFKLTKVFCMFIVVSHARSAAVEPVVFVRSTLFTRGMRPGGLPGPSRSYGTGSDHRQYLSLSIRVCVTSCRVVSRTCPPPGCATAAPYLCLPLASVTLASPAIPNCLLHFALRGFLRVICNIVYT